MAQNQPVKAIDVVPSDLVNIPQPGSVTRATDGTQGATFTSPTSTFRTDFISGGDVIIATQGGVNEMVEIESVISETELTTFEVFSFSNPITFKIYKGNGGLQNAIGNDGYSLFVGTGGDLAVLPAGTGQDEVILKNVANNSYVPLQVQRVLNTGTTAANVLALE
ncbi:MAG: hypothetical protein GY787_16375 [Alteromonadales bacterium]|nr:hypothetical protein [Alteromonadales bacterium]